ncbi:SMEK domain-containing protein [Methylobacter sp.]|uniref:SMEK domain-containing protein n=1 Tax=Methylobacter sp. TaxID=2051955 RepID=UPI002FDC9347
MQNRQQAFNNISRELAIGIQDIKQRQAIQDYSLNIHAENFFRDVFNCVYGCHFENANFQSANAPCLDLLDTQQKLAYQITSTISKEKIINTLQALAKPEYQGYEIRMFYLLGKPNLSAKSKQKIRTDFALNIDEHLFDCSDLIKDINNLKTDKLIALNHKYFKETYAEKADTPTEVDTFHLPEPTTALIGRKTELNQLTEAFKNPNKRLAIIVAAGGIGKSALTDEWLKQIEAQNYYGKTRVFGWSFYSQGSHNTFTNSQPFFSAVLPFLGVTEIPKDEIEKARLLARCLREQPCLLILDGLEPLQYAENLAAMNGELQDSALKEFIACFRQTAGKSFVLLSSRQPLAELKKWQVEHYLSLDLKTLPHEDGADLLQALGVTGNAEERQAISKDLNGHALSLVLMGHLLLEHYQGDCRYAKELPPLTSAHGDSDTEKDSRHALRVLDYYDSLQDEASRCFLQLMGLFDRPMDAAEKAVLIAKASHAEPLRGLTAKERQAVELRLEKSGLLLGKKGSFGYLKWDTHPIIRAYFGEKFKENHSEAFKQAHWVLACYYYDLPEKELPDTLEEMQPLYRAMVHGCLAEEYERVLAEVYYQRIARNQEGYSLHQLGAYSQDLTALSAFFSFGWNDYSHTNLTEIVQASVLGNISFCLMSLGRLQDAIEPRMANLKLCEKLDNWIETTRAAQNLADLYLHLGQLELAYDTVTQKQIEYAQLSEHSFSKIKSQCYLATVLYRTGNLSEAIKHFQHAEILQQQDGFQHLSSLLGFEYCGLLIDTAYDKNTLRTAIAIVKHNSKLDLHLLDDALMNITCARICVFSNNLSDAEKIFQRAVSSIQKSNLATFTPLFYLYRADFYLTQNQLDPAQADLNSAWEIIERCGMKLYAVDYLLIHGRYSLAIKDHDTALSHYIEAKQLIQETGYHLRDAELDLFAAKLRQLDLPEHQRTNPVLYSQIADYYLQKAKNRIAEIGQLGLMRVIERDFPL